MRSWSLQCFLFVSLLFLFLTTLRELRNSKYPDKATRGEFLIWLWHIFELDCAKWFLAISLVVLASNIFQRLRSLFKSFRCSRSPSIDSEFSPGPTPNYTKAFLSFCGIFFRCLLLVIFTGGLAVLHFYKTDLKGATAVTEGIVVVLKYTIRVFIALLAIVMLSWCVRLQRPRREEREEDEEEVPLVTALDKLEHGESAVSQTETAVGDEPSEKGELAHIVAVAVGGITEGELPTEAAKA